GKPGALAAGALRPVQHRAAGVMPAGADEREPRKQLLGVALPERDARAIAHDPFAVCLMQMHGDIAKGLAPFHHGRVIVRMRDGDALETPMAVIISTVARSISAIQSHRMLPCDVRRSCAR